MDGTRVNGTGQQADPLDVALQAMREYEHFANDLLVQEAIKAGDHLELYVMERRTVLAMAYAQAYQATVTNRLLGHLVHAVNGLAHSKCVWRRNKHYEYWSADCGLEWSLDEGDPVDNGMRFCPNCGGALVVGEEEAGG